VNNITQPGELIVSFPLGSGSVAKLLGQAKLQGLSLEAYLRRLAEQKAEGNGETPATAQPLTDEEFERSLDELARGSTLPPLPADFSRADIYSDHD
jgi:hypothetical protein